MSGPAGRRGKDDRGLVILMVDLKMSRDDAKHIIKGATDPLNSQFRLTYNMILNLMRVDGINPEFMLERSFFQFQNQDNIPQIKQKLDDLSKTIDSTDVKMGDDLTALFNMEKPRNRSSATGRQSKRSSLNQSIWCHFYTQVVSCGLLPHSSRTFSNTYVCIFMPDLDQTEKERTDPDVDKQARQWAEQIEKDHGLTGNHYAKLMTKRQLEREGHSYRECRALTTLYDVFLVEARCAKSVNTFLGKEFHRVHKIPLWFEYSKPLSTAINEALSTVTFPLN